MRCLDRRVLIGLAAAGVAVLVARPEWLGAVTPLLIVLACPLSMLLMMRPGRSCGVTGSVSGTDHELDDLRVEITRLRAEVEGRRTTRDA